MKRSDLKELIKKSMLEVAPKEDSGAMTPEEEEIFADHEREQAEMDLSSGPTVVPGAVPMREDTYANEDVLREADEIVAAWAQKQTIKEEMHGGYLELLEMNQDFEDGVTLIKDGISSVLTAWNEWKEGDETEPEMVEEAKHDVLTYLSMVIDKHLSSKMN